MSRPETLNHLYTVPHASNDFAALVYTGGRLEASLDSPIAESCTVKILETTPVNVNVVPDTYL